MHRQRRRRRDPLDLVLVGTSVVFFLTSWLFDRVAALDRLGPESGDPFAAQVLDWGARFDPMIAANPPTLQVMSWVSWIGFGLFYPLLAVALTSRARERWLWIRTPALMVSGAMIYAMVVHVALTAMWPEPVPSPGIYAAMYFPYLLYPLAVVYRMHQAPFAVPHQP